uniref:Centromere protein O n=1 Tax=Kalanchoe fedtschenkoi TaxID=63787 RepID=A0A7N0U842_KALFE
MGLTAEVNSLPEEDHRLETTRARFLNLIKRHEELTERLSRDSDKVIFERLQKEFEAARASSQEILLRNDEWNDGLLATVREQVHMEVDRKALSGDARMQIESQLGDKYSYRAGHKLICCLEGARIGIQYETYFAGEPCELYHCVLESKSFLEKMVVSENTIPFFLPIKEAETDLLSTNAMRFIDHVGELLQAYVDRREQVRLIKELYQDKVSELYYSLPYHMVEFLIEETLCKITVSLRYADLVSVLPTRVSVVAWPRKTASADTASPKRKSLPVRLTSAEEAFRNTSLPEAFAETVLNLPQALEPESPE